MTGLTALEFGFSERGFLREGFFADITLFDPTTIIDRSTFEEPIALSDGIELVMVNGAVVWEDRKPTGARPGRVLKRSAMPKRSGEAGSPTSS